MVKDNTKVVDPASIIDLTDLLLPGGQLQWDVLDGQWVILRNGYTLTGQTPLLRSGLLGPVKLFFTEE